MNTGHRGTLASRHGSRVEALHRLATSTIRTRDRLQGRFRTHVSCWWHSRPLSQDQ